ncbi:hypothetical protein [Streptomyces tendae]|uniref:hypothetical protein n=1 Tax=Streptomyces tendae TaxID=1932 RepID=UPI0036524856
MTFIAAEQFPAASITALAVALIALIGAVFAPMYTKYKEDQAKRRDNLRKACRDFETECDELQDQFAGHVVAVAGPEAGYDVDLTQVTPGNRPWHTVSSALNKVERSARWIGYDNKALHAQAGAILRSLAEEVKAIKEAAGMADPEQRDTRLREWEAIRQQSDRLRKEFAQAVADQT